MFTSNFFVWLSWKWAVFDISSRKRFSLRFLLVPSSVSYPRGPATASWKICYQEPLIRLRSSSSCSIRSSSSSIELASDYRRRLTSLTAARVLYQIVISNKTSKDDNHFSEALAWLSYSLVRSRFSNAYLRATNTSLRLLASGLTASIRELHLVIESHNMDSNAIHKSN